jgi:glucosamine 6-phosphate synthetase-like amidotransferase/phosphosugar isomerase protein
VWNRWIYQFREAYPIVIKGLKRLEYRGYDSAGVMLYDGEKLKVSKTKGKVVDLEAKASKRSQRMEVLALVIHVGQHMVCQTM